MYSITNLNVIWTTQFVHIRQKMYFNFSIFISVLADLVYLFSTQKCCCQLCLHCQCCHLNTVTLSKIQPCHRCCHHIFFYVTNHKCLNFKENGCNGKIRYRECAKLAKCAKLAIFIPCRTLLNITRYSNVRLY